jgi:hypothetical protein
MQIFKNQIGKVVDKWENNNHAVGPIKQAAMTGN